MEILDPKQWLPWLIRVRFVIISFLLAIQLILQQAAQMQGLIVVQVPLPYFLSILVFWYLLALIFHLLHRMKIDEPLQANLQMVTDSVMVSLVVYVTGGVDSFFYFLFPVVILMGTVVLSRMVTYQLAALCFVEAALVLMLPFAGVVRSYSIEEPSLDSLQFKIATNLAAFFAVAFLAGKLSDTLRRSDAELKDRAGQIEDLRALNQDIVESMRGGLITTDLDGRILLLNTPGAEILGTPFGALAGKSVGGIFPGLSSPMRGAIANPRMELLWQPPAGEPRYLGFSVAPLTRNGAVDGFVYNFQDVTQLKQLQSEIQLKDRMAAIGRMAAAIAHEIRNPLASIAGSVKLFSKRASLSADEQKLIAIVQKESERLNGIITDFLLYSREKTYEFSPVNLVEVTEETLTLLGNHPRMDARMHIERLLPAHPVVAFLDADRIKQVLWNLGDNAIKAMPRGGTLSVELRRHDERAEILFRDTGIGIKPEQAEKIFEPFQSEFSGGTGLGLAIAYQIVQAHGGTIRAESAGQGSVFRIELPLGMMEGAAEDRAAGAHGETTYR